MIQENSCKRLSIKSISSHSNDSPHSSNKSDGVSEIESDDKQVKEFKLIQA
jgi:hypothetical protein